MDRLTLAGEAEERALRETPGIKGVCDFGKFLETCGKFYTT